MLTITEYAEELPVALADVKSHLGIEQSIDDARITALIWAAVEMIETETGKSFAANAYKLSLPGFRPSCRGVEYRNWDACYGNRNPCIRLPRYPVVEPITIKYYDETNTEQTLSSDDYVFLNGTNQQPEIYPVYSLPFPVTYPRPDAVNITFTTGTTAYPPLFPMTVKLIVGFLNENREGQAKDIVGLDRFLGLLRDGGYH